ncbi:endonuclease [Flavobacterium algicola]|uniref:endonuclease n=1 Tax=Flavobacterium algicola TaxID=556529 RepID=UPI001EFD61E6|nr:endonuclease [Flavobacterium algicola]MCG9793799.1 endonuclease [Flavobacterium algicola]
MKLKLLFLSLLLTTVGHAQIPADYYSNATGTGYTLKTQLYNTIKDHTVKSYGDLYTTYQTSDRDYYYENDGTVLDMYSEKPSGADPYNYSSGSTQRCGNYSSEGDCYNREHIIPQSTFGSASPMVSDAHFITPTDGKVNGIRSNFPHGIVATVSQTSLNGSKLGTSAIAGYTGSIFEPIDEFKGDIARMYFYFATRYETTVSGYPYAMFNGTSTQVFTTDFLNMLLSWSAMDPVNQREIDRNNAIYAQQGNRNPYIDHPEFVQKVWNAAPDTQAPTAAANLVVSSLNATSVTLTWQAGTDDVAVTSYDVYVDGVFKAAVNTTTAVIRNLTPSTTFKFYVIAKDAAVNASQPSNTVIGMTTAPIVDTESPTAPTNLNSTASTSSSISLNWTVATDNIEVAGYDVYVNDVLNTTLTGNTVQLSGLTPLTTYSIFVIAKDASNNFSLASNTISITTLATSPVPEFCGSENFETVPTNNSSYLTRTWTNNGITWTATDARTDQSINTRSIAIRNGSLTSSIVEHGIHDITVTTKLTFSGTNGTFTVRVNGEAVGTVPYSATTTTTTIPGIDVSGNVIISFTDNSTTSNRVIFDDLGWSCYTEDLGTNDLEKNTFSIYPNPVDDYLYIENSNNPFSVSIFNSLGQTVKKRTSTDGSTMVVSDLNKGIYFVKITEGKKSVTKKIIVN